MQRYHLVRAVGVIVTVLLVNAVVSARQEMEDSSLLRRVVRQVGCKKNEEFKICSSLCEPRCEPENKPCPRGCGPPGCQCLPGFFRNGKKCTKAKKCPTGPPAPSGRCGKNEKFVTCSSQCEPTCRSSPNDPCTMACGPPKCQCDQGFVRDQGKCIPRFHCPAMPWGAPRSR